MGAIPEGVALSPVHRLCPVMATKRTAPRNLEPSLFNAEWTRRRYHRSGQIDPMLPYCASCRNQLVQLRLRCAEFPDTRLSVRSE
jgi:hypothetical protein